MTASARIFGDPRPQGSKRAIVNRHTGRPVVLESSGEGLKTWRSRVATGLFLARPSDAPWDGPVVLAVTFWLHRPKKSRHPELPAGKPDIDKLLRAVLDELSGLWIRDDAQIVAVDVRKRWEIEREAPGALIELSSVGPDA